MPAIPAEHGAPRAPVARTTYPPIAAGMPPETRVKLAQIIGDAGTPGIFPVSKTQFYRLVRRGKMPAPLKPFPGARASFWRLGDVLEAIQHLEDAAGAVQYETPLARKRRAAAGA